MKTVVAGAQRAVLGVILALLALTAFGGTAGATTMDVTVVAASSVSTDPTVLTGSVCAADAGQSASGFLPVNRWADATTGFHSRLDADAWNDVSEKIQRDGWASAWMQVGNAAWSLSTNLLYASTSFCPIKTLGYPMDRIVAVIGGAVTTSGLLVAILSWMVCSTLWRLHRGGNGAYVAREFVKTGIVLGFVFSMVAGAQASTSDAPGRGSPWWWVAQANNAVNSLSGQLSGAVLEGADGIALGYQKLSDESELDASEWTLHCAPLDGQDTAGYVDYLHSTYTSSWTDPESGAVTEGSALPATVSSLWEATTLPVWAGTQFGTNNPYSDQMFCFALEASSMGTSADESTFVSYLVSSLGITRDEAKKIVEDTHALDVDSTTATDNAWAGWAECSPTDATTAEPRTRWASIADREADDACGKWWTGGDISRSNLNWDDDEDAIAKATGEDREAEENFLDSLHGKGGSNTGVATVLYGVGSIINAAVFIMIAAMQGLSKIILVFMVAGIFAALVRSLTPGDDSALFKQSAKQLLGAAFVSSCAGLLISVILLIAAVITGAAVNMFGAGTTGAIISACLGPALGAWFVHWLFSSVLALPSPFTVKGMAAWGRGITSGVIGGAVGAGLVSAAGGLTRHGGRNARHIWDKKRPRVTGNTPQRGVNAADKGESATVQADRGPAKARQKKERNNTTQPMKGRHAEEPPPATPGRSPGAHRAAPQGGAAARARRIKSSFTRPSGRHKALPEPRAAGAHRAPLASVQGIKAAAGETRAAAGAYASSAWSAGHRAVDDRVARTSHAIDRVQNAGQWARRGVSVATQAAGVAAVAAVAGPPVAAGAAAVLAGRSFAHRVRDYRAAQQANPEVGHTDQAARAVQAVRVPAVPPQSPAVPARPRPTEAPRRVIQRRLPRPGQ
ncbi:MAG: hypothetical protein Q4C85_07355 [Actinomyces sp.]|uniref:hypothetical protein n=1 Tax=Actinomyces sp. TaxID=29317 RepID=UPI0026DD1090|nr:hypothetical protein [Actinomyces sp.]MDO4243560.1 hypothetical protein [Actinomyces sp.]